MIAPFAFFYLDKRLHIALTLFLALLSAGVRSYGINDPWVQGELGWAGHRSSTIARNYVRFGYLDTRLGAVRNVGPLRPERFTYDERPHLIYWLTSLSFRLFGVHEWSATLVPILCSAVSVGLLFMLALRVWGLEVALLASGFMILMPMDAYYGRMVSHEVPTLTFALLAFNLYLWWLEQPSSGRLFALLAVVAGAALSDFPGYFVAVWLALYHLIITARKRQGWQLSLLIAGVAVGMFVAWTLYQFALTGSFAMLTSRWAFRRSQSPAWAFTPTELYRLEFVRARGLYTPVIQFLVGAWAFILLVDLLHGHDLKRHAFLLVLGGFGLTYPLAFPHAAYQHEYALFYVTPFLCIASAWALLRASDRLFGRRNLFKLGLILLIFVVFAELALGALAGFYLPREAGFVRVAQYLSARLAPNEKVLEAIQDSIHDQWVFYLDRPSEAVTELPEFELRAFDSAYRYFVVDTRLAHISQELRNYLMTHYPVEAREAFLIFDLRARRTSRDEVPHIGPNLGAAVGDGRLTLVGCDLPETVSWPQPSPEDQFLYSSSVYWPTRREIPVHATLYWRCEQAISRRYVPSVALRTQYDRAYELEPAFAPQMKAYGPENWHPGDVVRTDYFFYIPPGYPSMVYSLAIRFGNDKEEEAQWITVGQVTVQPDTYPKPLPTPPTPQYVEEAQPVPGLKLLGYDLDRTSTETGSALRLSAYWTVELGLKADYAVLAQLQNGAARISERFPMPPTRLWEPGQFYRTDLLLPIPLKLLPGRYTLSLLFRGTTKASLPLTTIDVMASRPLGLVRQWGDAGQDLRPVSPESPVRLNFSLGEPRDLLLTVAWTGRTEIDRTRLEVYVSNKQWQAPRKYLITWLVQQNCPDSGTVRIPAYLTQRGTNTIEIRVPPAPPEEIHPLGWLGVLDSILPDLLRDPGAGESGAVELDYVRVASTRPVENWEQFALLGEAYAERGMWGEVVETYRMARAKGLEPTLPEELSRFLEAAERVGDTNLKGELDRLLAKLVPNPARVVLGDRIEFLGWEAKRLEGTRVRFELIFRVLKALPLDYTLWMHAAADPSRLFGHAQEVGFAGLDHPLNNANWQPGGIYRDSYEADLLPADYQVTFGIWRPADGSRLYRSDVPGEHIIDLGRVSLP